MQFVNLMKRESRNLKHSLAALKELAWAAALDAAAKNAHADQQAAKTASPE